MSEARKDYESLITTLREISLLGSVSSVLHWDERTQMPPQGAEHRSNQISLLARITHDQFTTPKIDDLLKSVEASDLIRDPASNAAVNARETRRSYDRARKLPSSLVEEMAKTAVLAQNAWVEARKKSDYGAFEPWLAKTLELKRREADCIGFAQDRYDALVDDFEPGETRASLQRVFDELRGPLVELIANITSSRRKSPFEILERHYPAAAQEKLAREAASAIGFDFSAGRLDVSVHPFCSGLGPGDTRLTTRYDEKYFGDAFFGTLHETGHGLYHQGLDPTHYGTPRGEEISLGIHESQSRMWENLVGRSRAFWRFFLPKARAAFPEVIGDSHNVSEDAWYFAVNDVRPSLIRTEADEATYNLHVFIRFELEPLLISGDLPTRDLPAVWNARMKSYLHVDVPDDTRGCLQDIHWSGGAFGYFPTYTLGNLYAAQFFEQARSDVGDLDAMFARGEFAPLLEWLRAKIHRSGKRYRARELVKQVTGQDLSAGPLLAHLRRKAAELYGV